MHIAYGVAMKIKMYTVNKVTKESVTVSLKITRKTVS